MPQSKLYLYTTNINNNNNNSNNPLIQKIKVSSRSSVRAFVCVCVQICFPWSYIDHPLILSERAFAKDVQGVFIRTIWGVEWHGRRMNPHVKMKLTPRSHSSLLTPKGSLRLDKTQASSNNYKIHEMRGGSSLKIRKTHAYVWFFYCVIEFVCLNEPWKQNDFCKTIFCKYILTTQWSCKLFLFAPLCHVRTEVHATVCHLSRLAFLVFIYYIVVIWKWLTLIGCHYANCACMLANEFDKGTHHGKMSDISLCPPRALSFRMSNLNMHASVSKMMFSTYKHTRRHTRACSQATQSILSIIAIL